MLRIESQLAMYKAIALALLTSSGEKRSTMGAMGRELKVVEEKVPKLDGKTSSLRELLPERPVAPVLQSQNQL